MNQAAAHILIVDDIPKNIELLGSLLGSEGYEISFARSGSQGLAALEHHQPDLILLDINMPGMSGFEVCREIKSQEKFLSLPVIFLTADQDEDKIQEGFDCGAVDYLTKPFKQKELLVRVKNHLELAGHRKRQLHMEENLKSMVSQRTEMLSRALEEVRQASDAKTNFLANMSHELRTPLNGILGFSNILSLGDLPESDAEYVRYISECAEILLELVNNILDYSKMEVEALSLDAEIFSINDAISKVFVAVPPKDGVEKKLNLLEKDFYVSADSLRLRQCLLNLLNNAMKFTDEGEVVLSVESLGVLDSYLTLRFMVKDSGIGIKENSLKKVFQAFEQADSSMTRKYGGTGLGLTISAQILTLMKSSLELKSEWGKGSEFAFKVTFPLGVKL